MAHVQIGEPRLPYGDPGKQQACEREAHAPTQGCRDAACVHRPGCITWRHVDTAEEQASVLGHGVAVLTRATSMSRYAVPTCGRGHSAHANRCACMATRWHRNRAGMKMCAHVTIWLCKDTTGVPSLLHGGTGTLQAYKQVYSASVLWPWDSVYM